MRTDCNNYTVTLSHISAHPPIPFLPYSHSPSLISFSSSVSALICFSLSLLALSWSSFLLFICYSLNHGSLMSFTLTFFIRQCVCLSPHHPLPSLSPISASISFKTLITRSASTLATPPVTLVPTNSYLLLYSRGFCSNHQAYSIRCSSFIPVACVDSYMH